MKVVTYVPSSALVSLKSISTCALRPKLRAWRTFVTVPSPREPFVKTSTSFTNTSSAT